MELTKVCKGFWNLHVGDHVILLTDRDVLSMYEITMKLKDDIMISEEKVVPDIVCKDVKGLEVGEFVSGRLSNVNVNSLWSCMSQQKHRFGKHFRTKKKDGYITITRIS